MTPEEQATVKENLRQVAEILYKNTSSAELTSFETIELSVREHLQETVAPEISNFFSTQQEENLREEKEKFAPCVGKITISSKQAIKLGLKKGTRLSPHLEKCCLLLVGNESFANAERDIENLTGVRIAHSTQHRLVGNYQLPEPKITKRAEALSVDGGSVRLRTPLGQKSEWKNYKALKVHERVGVAFFQDNQSLIEWINQQALSRSIACLGDGHNGIWNIIQQISSEQQRREVLDWYHLKENLDRVGGSIRRLRRVENYLWQGLVTEAIAEFDGWENKKAQNFPEYLRKHQGRIPDYYQLYQELGICIDSRYLY